MLNDDLDYFEMAQYVAEEYADFRVFAAAAMLFLGFRITDMQADIADFMAKGPRLSMVMAQRGEAKSTLAAIYGVWCLTQRPNTRILIVSGGGKQAGEVALLMIRMIMRWDLLAYLRPDKAAGDKDAADHFEVNYRFKPVDKSPSIASVGLNSHIQGKRADLLIPDDKPTVVIKLL